MKIATAKWVNAWRSLGEAQRRNWLAGIVTLVVAAILSISLVGLRNSAIAQSSPPAQTERYLPENRLAVGEVISPTQAYAFLDASAPANDPALSTPALCTGDVGARDPRILEVAAGLPADADEIFKYVHDSVAFEPVFGLKKGAVGAILDGNGGPFDHAHLLVELLRAKGICARYVFGTAEASLSQLQAWIGVDDLQAAERIFADGGIPVERLSDRLRFAHMWIQLYGASGSTTYDPAFKQGVRTLTGFDVATAVGITSSGLRAALGGTSPSSPTSDRDYDASGLTTLDTHLNGKAAQLAALLETNAGRASLATPLQTVDFASLSFDDVLGLPTNAPLAAENLVANPALRAPLLAYGAPQKTWYEMPTRLKTAVRISVGTPGTQSGEATTYIDHVTTLDKVANQRVVVTTTFQGAANYNQLGVGRLKLLVDGAEVGVTPELSSDAEYWAWAVSVEFDHPYPGSDGRYADRAIVSQVDPKSVSVVLVSAGQVGDGRRDRIARDGLEEVELTRSVWLNANPANQNYSCPYVVGIVGGDPSLAPGSFCQKPRFGAGSWGEENSSIPECGVEANYSFELTRFEPCGLQDADARGVVAVADGVPSGLYSGKLLAKVRAANEWLYASAKARRATAGLSHGVSQDHGTVVVASSNVIVENDHNSVFAESLRIHTESTLSFNEAAGPEDAAARKAMMFAYSAAASALEGFALQSVVGATQASSLAEKFRWSIQYQSGQISEGNPRGLVAGPEGRFRSVTSTQYTTQGAAVWSGSTPVHQDLVQSRLLAGYSVYRPYWQTLGPEMRPRQRLQQGSVSDAIWYNEVYQQGATAFLLVNPTTGAVAHLVTDGYGGIFKGGTSTAVLESIAAPTAITPGFAKRSDPTSSLYAVDDREGRLVFTPPADISIGEGDHQLVYQRTYSSDLAATELGRSGWTHNHKGWVSLTSGGDARFGAQRPVHSAAMLVAIAAALKLGDGEIDLDDAVTSELTASWWTRSLVNSHAIVGQGASQVSFYKTPGGGWTGETRRAGVFTQTGAITAGRVAE